MLGPLFEMLLTVGAVSRRGRPTLISASSALVSMADMKRAPLWPDPLEHAGKRDTSVSMAIAMGAGSSAGNGAAGMGSGAGVDP